MKVFRTNYEHFEKQGNKYTEDGIFKPKSLDNARLMIHLYTAWPQQHKAEIFYRENEFFWVCLEVLFFEFLKFNKSI